MATANKKGRDSGKYATPTTKQHDTAWPKSSSKSTTSAAQQRRILEALATRPHTSYELRKLGCYQAPTRIIELRRKGYNISTERVSIWDDEGYRHDGVGLYTLHGGGA